MVNHVFRKKRSELVLSSVSYCIKRKAAWHALGCTHCVLHRIENCTPNAAFRGSVDFSWARMVTPMIQQHLKALMALVDDTIVRRIVILWQKNDNYIYP